MNKSCIFFKTSLSSGGAEHQLVFLANELAMVDYNVKIATFADLEDHYEVCKEVSRIRLAKGHSKFVKFLAIWLYFIHVKTDVIIIFGQRESLMLLPILFFRPKVKVLAGERSLTLSKPTPTEKFLFKILYKRANYIIPNSISQGNRLVEINHSLKNKIKPIINYTDLNIYKPKDNPINGILRIGVIARFNKAKNYARFGEAIDLLRNRIEQKFVVEWYGSIHQKGTISEDYVIFNSIIKERNLQEFIHLHDHVKNISDLICTFDVMCLPSIYEGFSNSLSEYICCGRPVLASDVSDNSLMVHDGENGFLFDPKDVGSIVSAFIKFICLKKEDQLKMGDKSRAIAESLFCKERFLKSYVKLIESK